MTHVRADIQNKLSRQGLIDILNEVSPSAIVGRAQMLIARLSPGSLTLSTCDSTSTTAAT